MSVAPASATSSADPSLPTDTPTLNERGNLHKEIGEEALLYDDFGDLAVKFKVTKIVPGLTCDSEYAEKSKHGWYVGIWMEIQTSDVVDMDAADASIPYFTTDSWKVIGPDGFTENDTEGNAKLCADDSTTLVTQLEGQQKVRGLVVLDTKYRSGHLVLVQDYLDGGWEWDF